MKNGAGDIHELKELVQRTVKEKVQPLVAGADRDTAFPEEVTALYRSLDLYRLIVPQALGGLEAPVASLLAAVEEISAVCAGMASLLTVPAAGLYAALSFMDSPQINALDSGYLSGERSIAYTFSGADGEAADSDFPFSYTETGNTFVISGTAPRALLAGYASAAIICARRTGDNSGGSATVFFIDNEMNGVSAGNRSETLGLRVLPVAPLKLDRCTAPRSRMIGGEGQGREIVARTESFMRLMAAAQALGLLRCACAHAEDYGSLREQFGSKIGAFQAIRHMIADMRVSQSAGTGLLHRAAAAFEDGSAAAQSFCAQAKLFCADAAMAAAADSVQIHGGYGYMRDFPVEKLMRDAKMLQILFGTPHHLKDITAP